MRNREKDNERINSTGNYFQMKVTLMKREKGKYYDLIKYYNYCRSKPRENF